MEYGPRGGLFGAAHQLHERTRLGTDLERELADIRREVIEGRNLVIRTDNLLKTLHSEVKAFGARPGISIPLFPPQAPSARKIYRCWQARLWAG